MKIIPGCYVRLNFQALLVFILQNLNKGGEEVVQSIPELLNIRVLICRPFVSKHDNSLVDHLSVQIMFFPERLHHELLEVL